MHFYHYKLKTPVKHSKCMLLYKFAFKSHSILRIFLVHFITPRSFDGHLITTMASMNIEEQLEEQVYFCSEYM
jgi:hypothetical protein